MNEAPTKRETPNDNQMYCQECGNTISRKAEMCPDCGAPTGESSGLSVSANVLAVAGSITFVVGWIALAVIMGPLTFFLGYLVYRKDSWFVGGALMIGGVVVFSMWALFILLA